MATYFPVQTGVPDETGMEIPHADGIELGTAAQAIGVQVLVESTESVESFPSSSSDEDEKGSYYGSLCAFLLIFVSFCDGLYNSEEPLEQMKLTGFVQPPSSQTYLYMKAFSTYPDCVDQRYQIYRLFTSMLVHAGLVHFLMNMVCLLIFGPIYEKVTSAKKLWVVLLVGAAYGNMTAFYANPFSGTVGASGGMYAIIGAIISHIMLNPKSLSMCRHGLIAFFAVQSILDIAIAIMFPDILSWTCHLGGLVAGMLVDTLWPDLDSPDTNADIHEENENSKNIRNCSYTTMRMALRAVVIGIFVCVFMLYMTVENPVDHYHGGKYNDAVACCSEEFDNRSSCYM